MELQKRQFECETHQEVKVIGPSWPIKWLRVHDFIITTFTHSIIASIQIERGFGVFDYVFVNEYTCLQVVQFILSLVELKDFGRDAFVRSQELQIDTLVTHFSNNFFYHCNFGLL